MRENWPSKCGAILIRVVRGWVVGSVGRCRFSQQNKWSNRNAKLKQQAKCWNNKSKFKQNSFD